ncbi:B3 domain-containing protein Os04g0386900-like [Asparagus officinalis]|uniref:B3 domain-containing protein Os04g0386900-like n=1 Tax=Asparagus officinalis TaxID=4686 RepID=UPI00098E0AF7|nr:B3 domain-containing protein Os04g0386900-like [Asparagus officinalis]
MMNRSGCYSCDRYTDHKYACIRHRPFAQEPTRPLGKRHGKDAMNNAGPKAHEVIITSKEEVGPLSGNPFFTCILMKTQVEPPYQLSVPRAFHPFLPSSDVPVILSIKTNTWKVRYLGDRSIRRFDGNGWKLFAVDNKLRIGDGCVFELMDKKNLRLEIKILNGQVPDMFARTRVRSSESVRCNEPIVIEIDDD